MSVFENVAKDITLTGSDPTNDSLTYAIVATPAPSAGTVSLSGTTATFTPASDYLGSATFTFKVNDGAHDSTAATVSITVGKTVAYVRTSAPHTPPALNDLTHPYTTIDAAMQAVHDFGPTSARPVEINVGSGSFAGATERYARFGEHVTWVGAGQANTTVGAIQLITPDGENAVDDGNGTPANGNQPDSGYLEVTSDFTLTFGSIFVSPGASGSGVNGGSNASPANGGTLIFTGKSTGGLYAGGAGGSYGSNGGGGSITVTTGSSASYAGANAGSRQCDGNGCGNGSGGGTVYVDGTVTTVEANGAVDQSGGTITIGVNGSVATAQANGGDATYGGTICDVNGNCSDFFGATTNGGPGGTVIINGHANNAYAYGGPGSTCGNGGTIVINGSANQVEAPGANSGSYYTGSYGGMGYTTFTPGSGGTVIVNGTVGTVNVSGGTAQVAPSNPGYSGAGGGSVTVAGTVTGDIHADGGGSQNAYSGPGGSVSVYLGATAGNIYATGGGGYNGGGLGGSVVISGQASNVYVDGGSGDIGGSGGEIYLNATAATANLSALGWVGNSQTGNDGLIDIYTGAAYGTTNPAPIIH